MVQGFRAAFLLAAAAVCGALLQTAKGGTIPKEPIELDDVVHNDFLPDPFETKWISGSELLFEDDGELRVWDVASDKKYALVPKEVFAQYKPIKAKLSGNGEYVLFAYDAEKAFQDGGIARYMAYKIKDNTTTEIGGGERLQAAIWGGHHSQLAYVYGNNIYYLTEPGAEPIQITTDGVPGVIFNGLHYIRDHGSVAAEDSVGEDTVMKFSPDGTKLVYIQYNISLLRNASFILEYGAPGALENQYAKLATFRYQKVGTTGSRKHFKVATLPSENSTSVTIQELLAPVDVVSEDYYIRDFAWSDDNSLMAWFVNRFSNISQYISYFTCNESAQLTGEKGLKLELEAGWFEEHPILVRGASFLTIAWQPQGDAGSFFHVVNVTGDSMKAVTSGELTVTDLYGWDDNGTVYYQATEEGHPSRRQVYAVEEGGSPRCLSCSLKSPRKRRCLSASASFSGDLSWFTIQCSGPDPPFVTIHSAADNKRITWPEQSNKELRKRLARKLWPRQLDDWVVVEGGGGLRAQVRLLLPPDLDPEGYEKRPAMVHAYAGPNSQQVDDSFEVNLSSYFTTSRRYVVILIDGRGSGCKGDRTLYSVYRRLGTVEVEDQISVTKQLTKRYRFIDSSRVAIWGWSYGGYAAAMALARDDEGVFRCGVSVAPVTNWIYGIVDYCEEYMGLPTPEDNEAGYNASDVIRLAARFAKKKFLLVHGTADDNTFYQNSMLLARALEEAGVLFRQQIYPDKYHWLINRRGHLYDTMDQFFQECFDRTYLLGNILLEMST